MARRHEDRKPGQRVQRGPARGGGRKGASGPTRGSTGGPTRGSTGGPTRGTARPAAARGTGGAAVRRKSGIRVTPAKGRAADIADGKVRLNRFLAMAGVCSRRAADELIAAGSVEVNGEVVTELGQRIDPSVDRIAVDGEPVRQEKSVYVLFNKPKNVVCTNARHEQKKRVIDFLPDVRGRLFTVGRLDLDSEGLILLTNDGDFAQRLTHPRYGVPKLYSVSVRGRVQQKDLQRARGGVWLAEGPTTGMQIRVERAGNDRTFLKVTLREGKNREIRRVFAKLGFPVLDLKRIRIGDLTLHGLKPGDWRFLQIDEVRALLATSRGDGEGAPE